VALAVVCLALDNWLDVVRLPGSGSSSSTLTTTSNSTGIRHWRKINASHESSLPPPSRTGTLANQSLSAHQEDAAAEEEEPEDGSSANGQHQQETLVHDDGAPPPATIVCQLSADLGNNLVQYAHCHAVAQLLLRQHNLTTQIVIRHFEVRRWVRGARDMQTCIPFFRAANFSAANSKAYDRKRDDQLALLGPADGGVLVRQLVTAPKPLAPDKVDGALRLFADLVEASRRGEPPFPHAAETFGGENSSGTDSASEDIRLPFLYVSWLTAIDAYVDEFVGDFRRLFAFDAASSSSSAANGTNATHPRDDGCCNILPHEDETVFVR
jgi:hypothetical protein